MANAEVIRETLAVARENRHRFNMRTWISGQGNPDATSWQECGTTACLGGWRCLLDGLRPKLYPDGYVTTEFIDPSTGKTVHPEDWAMQRMELHRGEAEALLQATHLGDDIDAVERLAELVISGEWVGCESCGGNGGCGDCDNLGIVRYSGGAADHRSDGSM
jgi:hypothetical protein